MNITISSLNTTGLGNNEKRQQVFKYLEDKLYDIILLQETHSDATTNQLWKTEWEGESFFSGAKSNKEGVAFLINRQSDIKCSNFNEIVVGRMATLQIKINNKDITLVNVYGPNDDNTQIFEKLETFVANNDEQNLIIGGDFNTVLNPNIDKKMVEIIQIKNVNYY